MSTIESHLTPEQVREALDVLRKERDATGLSRRELIASRWLTILGLWVQPAFVLIFILMIAVTLISPSWLRTSDFSTMVLIVPLGILMFIFAGSFVVLILLNLTIPVKAIRQWWLMWRLKLTGQFQAVWTKTRSERRLSRRVTLVFAIVSCSLAILMFIGWYISERHGFDHFILALTLVIFLTPGFAWLGQRCQERIEILSHLDRLRALVSPPKAAEIGGVAGQSTAITADALSQVVQIQRAQIDRDRMEALREGRATGVPAYAVLKSPETQRTIRSLDLNTRLSVEDRIQELATELGTRGPAVGAAEALRIPVPDTSLTLLCAIDRQAQRITIIGIDGTHPGELNFTSTSRA